MLSQTEYQYIHDLVLQMYNQGYHDYVCITNNLITSNSSNIYDVECYFSKNDMEYVSNSFVAQNGVKIDLDSNSYSTTNTIDKIRRENFNSRTISLNAKEYVYSNVGQYSNLIADYETSLNNHLTIEFVYLIPCILILQILISWIRSVFKKKG